jgi:hypothetical protein
MNGLTDMSQGILMLEELRPTAGHLVTEICQSTPFVSCPPGNTRCRRIARATRGEHSRVKHPTTKRTLRNLWHVWDVNWWVMPQPFELLKGSLDCYFVINRLHLQGLLSSNRSPNLWGDRRTLYRHTV